MRKLVEEKHSFKVKAVIPIAGFAANRSLMPDLPGLSDSEKCSDWDTSIPIKMKLIREKDETYWKKYKGTPKAFISLKTAQKIWANRFGAIVLRNITERRFELAIMNATGYSRSLIRKIVTMEHAILIFA